LDDYYAACCKVLQQLIKLEWIVQALLAQFTALPVTAGSDVVLKQMLEAHVMVY